PWKPCLKRLMATSFPSKPMRASFLLTCLLLVLFGSAPVVADSDKPATTRRIAQAKPGNKHAEDKPKGQEADVLEFVREHHPELADLLKQLKDSRPKEYQKAVRDLSRVRERLFAMRKTDDHRYDLELAIWKAQTRIQLLAAKL